jgi:hypothetical protein
MNERTPIVPDGFAEWVTSKMQVGETPAADLTADRALYERGVRDGINLVTNLITVQHKRQDGSRHG